MSAAFFTSSLLLLLSVSECLPHMLLMATGRGVQTFIVDSGAMTTLHDHRVTAVDFRFAQEDLFFISDSDILYSYYSKYSGERADPVPTVRESAALTDLAVDWASYRLYYSCQDTSAIYEAALLGSSMAPRQIFSRIQGVKDLAVDPYQRLLFFTTDHALVSFGLQNHQVLRYQFTTLHVTHVVKVAVDHHEQRVYVVGYDEETLQWSMVRADYSNTEARLVLRGPELSSVVALDVFHQEVVWSSQDQGKYSLYSCKLTPDCSRDNLMVVLQTFEPIHSVRFYNPLVQTPPTSHACRRLNCSHSCSEVSLYYMACFCPEGLLLDASGNLCREPFPNEVKPVWTGNVEEFLKAMLDASLQWLFSQVPNITVLIYALCLLMLSLLVCGFCLLPCVKRPKSSEDDVEAYSLSERNDDGQRRRAQR